MAHKNCNISLTLNDDSDIVFSRSVLIEECQISTAHQGMLHTKHTKSMFNTTTEYSRYMSVHADKSKAHMKVTQICQQKY